MNSVHNSERYKAHFVRRIWIIGCVHYKLQRCLCKRQENMKPRTEISMELYQIMLDRGYSENLCDLVTRNLNTDYTAARMIGYLSHYSHLPELEVVDEMLAILSDRNALIKKKEAEEAQAKLNELYREGLQVDGM